MPRFFFNIYDGVDFRDLEGTELDDWQAARLAGIKFVGEVLASEASRVALGEGWHMEVTDDTGLVLFRMSVNLHEPTPSKPDDQHRTTLTLINDNESSPVLLK